MTGRRAAAVFINALDKMGKTGAAGLGWSFYPERRTSKSESLDVRFFAQAGDPAILNLLGFFLDQFLLDIGAHFGERFCAAAMFILNLQDVIVAGVIDDVADSADRHVEGELFQRFGQSFAFDPPPVAAVVL